MRFGNHWPAPSERLDEERWHFEISLLVKLWTTNRGLLRQNSRRPTRLKHKSFSVRPTPLLPICPRQELDNLPTPKQRNNYSYEANTGRFRFHNSRWILPRYCWRAG